MMPVASLGAAGTMMEEEQLAWEMMLDLEARVAWLDQRNLNHRQADPAVLLHCRLHYSDPPDRCTRCYCPVPPDVAAVPAAVALVPHSRQVDRSQVGELWQLDCSHTVGNCSIH